MQSTKQRRVSHCLSLVLLTLATYFSTPAYAEIKSSLESPLNNDTVAGIAVIRGWAFDTSSTVQISRIELFVDGVSRGNVACCTTRLDVQAAFPSDSNAANSGFGQTTNWGEFSAGTHTLRVEIHTSTGTSVVSDTRTITVVKPGNFSFLNQFTVDVDDSFAQIGENNTLCVDNIQITDKNTGATKLVKGVFRWQEACQCLTLINTEDSGFCDF